ncbi:MAG: 3-deoxy-8-phosphooctulonate synthase [Bdellovibrionales bacterium]|jgi:2-dehydro-3-deoxyphosphooctonate aldolase (KDO 8-P synthase)
MTNFKSLSHPISFQHQGQTYEWGSCKQWVLFAGPDIIEDEGMVIEVAQELKRITKKHSIPWILKCSYDKANRQSSDSFRGPGVKKALDSFARIKSKVGCPILTDVHETTQVQAVAEIADVVQIPAFLCRQTDLVVEVAKTGRVMHIKKGQFMAPEDMASIVKKAAQAGNDKVLLCERGTTFGYHRLVNDMPGLVTMRSTGKPVIMDITHSTQLPGAADGKSGGRREMAPVLARAAMAVGVDGIFVETHPNPDAALCDGPTSIALNEMENLIIQISKVWATHF